MKRPPPLILASTSRYRKELLSRLTLPFSCIAPGSDETPLPREPARALVARLARLKASAVAVNHPAAWVVGSDQTACRLDDAGVELTLGKPGNAAVCVEQLASCSARSIFYFTAVTVMRSECGSVIEFIDTTTVKFRPLDRPTIERYVAKEQPLDCAGGFKSEGLGIMLCESIETSDPSALIGLPLIQLGVALRRAGYQLP